MSLVALAMIAAWMVEYWAGTCRVTCPRPKPASSGSSRTRFQARRAVRWTFIGHLRIDRTLSRRSRNPTLTRILVFLHASGRIQSRGRERVHRIGASALRPCRPPRHAHSDLQASFHGVLVLPFTLVVPAARGASLT